MTNLDSILKSKDITLPTKVYLVKAMVFPVVMYGCESWTIKKVEHQSIDAFDLRCCGRLFFYMIKKLNILLLNCLFSCKAVASLYKNSTSKHSILQN